jgi:hypothetical protein
MQSIFTFIDTNTHTHTHIYGLYIETNSLVYKKQSIEVPIVVCDN